VASLFIELSFITTHYEKDPEKKRCIKLVTPNSKVSKECT